MLLFSVKYLIYRQFFNLCFWNGQVSCTKLSKTRRQAKVMIFLLESNRHASIACNNSRFYRVLQNSRSVKHIRYINYLCMHFCRVMGKKSSYFLFFFFFLPFFPQSLGVSIHEPLQPFKNFTCHISLGLSTLSFGYLHLLFRNQWMVLKSNSKSDLTVVGSSAVSHYPLSYQEKGNIETPKTQI